MMKIELLDSVDSTNEYIRRYLPAREDVIVCADIQTGGRGTKGRSFLSCGGGVYFSALEFYHGVPAKDAFLLMMRAAVSVCRTADSFGLSPEIKWPNDVLVCGRKLAGILIENSFSGGLLDWSITGIGLNAENPLTGLENIAISLSGAAGRHISVQQARERLTQNFRKQYTYEDYLSYVRFLGKQIRVTEGEESYIAVARNILPDGRLEIEKNGKIRALSAAEISIRLEG